MAKKSSVVTPRFKKQRRLGTELPGLGKSGALERRPYPPGQHGNQRRKLSEYALRLEEKQKILHHYDLRESQLRRYVRLAKQGKVVDWVDKLIGILERRVDNVIFRLGFAPSIRAARQMISHGHILLNGKKHTVASAILKKGDTVALTEKSYQGTLYLQAKQSPRLELPDYLGIEGADAQVGTIKDIPHSSNLPFPFEVGLLAEYYAARM